ncbi:MAG: Thiol peroxidase, Bcp-type, partial [uncultured Solirubrobacteraceae bacterium]
GRSRQPGPRVHPPRPGRRRSQPREARGPPRRPLLLPQGRHAGLYDAGLFGPRPLRRVRRARSGGARRLARPGREGQGVPREAPHELHAAGRRRPCGRRPVRHLGGDVEERQDGHGQRTRDVRHRTRRHHRARLPKGLADDARRHRARRPLVHV